MAAPENNQFWKQRSKHGRDTLFADADKLWEAACEYFEWCDENPLQEEKGFAYEGRVSKENFSKMRAYTMGGLCIYLDCALSYFRNFNTTKKPEFAAVISKIKEIVYQQKFTGAAANLLNPNIIARDLGLRDHADLTTKGEPINPVITTMKDGRVIDLKAKDPDKTD